MHYIKLSWCSLLNYNHTFSVSFNGLRREYVQLLMPNEMLGVAQWNSKSRNFINLVGKFLGNSFELWEKCNATENEKHNLYKFFSSLFSYITLYTLPSLSLNGWKAKEKHKKLHFQSVREIYEILFVFNFLSTFDDYIELKSARRVILAACAMFKRTTTTNKRTKWFRMILIVNSCILISS